jgi:lipopolysaccharide export LptBFGC system permease protein LptF
MMFPRRHDRYVLKAFWSTFGAVVLFFTVVIIVIHLAERTAKLIRYWEPLQQAGYDPFAMIFQYYAILVPFIWLQVAPLCAALATAFSLTRLTRNHEVAPLITAGVSERRLTLPLLVSGLVLGGILLGTQEWIVPRLARVHTRLSCLLGKNEPDRVSRIPHFQDPGGARLSAAAWRPIAREIEGVLLTLRDETGATKELQWYPVLAWDAAASAWVAPRGGTRFPLAEDPLGTLRRPVPEGARAPLLADVLLYEVSVSQDTTPGLSPTETAALLAADPQDARLQVLHHAQFTHPLSVLVLLLMCMPFCLRLESRSAIPGIVAALVGGVLYYGLGFLTSGLASSGDVNPVFLAWLPTVLLGSLGAALYLTMDG